MVSFLYQAAFNAVWSFFLAAGRGSDLGAFFLGVEKMYPRRSSQDKGSVKYKNLKTKTMRERWEKHIDFHIHIYVSINIQT